MTEALAELVMRFSKASELIEKSSLGTEGARRLRRRTTDSEADAVSNRVAEAQRQRTFEQFNLTIERQDALARGAAQANIEATDELLNAIYPVVSQYFRDKLVWLPLDELEELAQHACLSVANELVSRHYRDGSLPHVVHQVAVHTVSQVVSMRPPHAGRSDNELTRKILHLLAQFPDDQRSVLTLRIICGLSVNEVADSLQIRGDQVRMLQHRALSKLRRFIKDSDD